MAESFLPIELDSALPHEAAFHVIPVPYERTVSYGTGTAGGPVAIIRASEYLEAFLDGVPGAAGIHTAAAPDLSGSPEAALAAIDGSVAAALEAGALPVMLGGEHTVTYPAVRAVHRFLRQPLGVVQFDAHADLRDTYQGTRWSHGCVMRRIWDEGIPILQIGVRSLSVGEHCLRQEKGIPHLDAETYAASGAPHALVPEWFPAAVYVTFDLDAFDPSIMPATGTPEPGGLLWWDAVRLLQRVLAGRRLVGADVVELAPVPGLHHCDFTAAKLVYTLMGLSGRVGKNT